MGFGGFNLNDFIIIPWSPWFMGIVGSIVTILIFLVGFYLGMQVKVGESYDTPSDDSNTDAGRNTTCK